jgi:hypothetical protein
LSAFAACLVVGCGGGSDANQPGPSSPAKKGPKVVKVADLPELEDYLPPLDDGRVEVAGPEGWHPMSRKEEFVARFAPDGGSGAAPPRVLVTAEAAPGGSPTDVTAKNVDKFEAYIGPVLKAELGGKKDIREPVRMLIIGDRPWARYVRIGSLRGAAVERQFLKTVANGRIYTVELQVFRGNLLEYRDAAYAIAAGMKFHKVDAAGEDGTGDDSLGDLLGEQEEGGGDEDGGAGEGAGDADEG